MAAMIGPHAESSPPPPKRMWMETEEAAELDYFIGNALKRGIS